MPEYDESCPKCHRGPVVYDGAYTCLWRDCGHKWFDWPEGPRRYSEVRSSSLKCSLPPGGVQFGGVTLDIMPHVFSLLKKSLEQIALAEYERTHPKK